MGNNSKFKFPVMFEKVDDLVINDERFTKVRIWLMHLGQNFNGSIFEKEIVEEAFPSLAYIPIVGFIENNSENEKDFSDHRYILTKKDGEITRKYIGHAYGTILSSADNNAHFEDRLCDDGETRTFVVVDGIIWNQFEDSSEIINRDVTKSHSMELWENSVKGYEDENFIFHFTEFSFRAACILGIDYEAGMQNSTIEVQFTMNDFVKNIQSELSNKLSSFNNYMKEHEVINQKGGNLMGKPEGTKTDFSLTVMEQFNEISNIVSDSEKVRDYWGDEVPRYYVRDIQDDEVIVIDRSDNYNCYGLKFTLDGDKPVIDFDSKIRKKTQYVDYVEGADIEGTFSFAKQIEEFEKSVTEKIESLTMEKNEIETNYTTVKEEYEEIKPKYDDYVRIEAERIQKETKEAKDQLFTKFDEHLIDVADYVALKEKRDDFTLEEIQGKCAFMFTEKNLKTNFSKKQKNENQMTADILDILTEEDGIVQTKYGAIKTKRI